MVLGGLGGGFSEGSIIIYFYFNSYTYITIDNNFIIKKFLYEKSNINNLQLNKKDVKVIRIYHNRLKPILFNSYNVFKFDNKKDFLNVIQKVFKINLNKNLNNLCYVSLVKYNFFKSTSKTKIILIKYPYIFRILDDNENRAKDFLKDNCKKIQFINNIKGLGVITH